MSKEIALMSPSTPAPVREEDHRAVAEVKGMVQVAQLFRRDVVAAEARIKKICQNQKLAEQAVYSFPRGGEMITGASIRLVEALALEWGNIDSGYKIIADGPKEATVVAYAWDMQSNTRSTKQFVVPHLRSTKSGPKPLTDPRDKSENIANMAMRKVRACLLALIPVDIVSVALDTCAATLSTNFDGSRETVDNLLAAFAAQGVSAAMIKGYCGKPTPYQMTAGQYAALRQIYRGLTEGVASVESYFDVDVAAPEKSLHTGFSRETTQSPPPPPIAADAPPKSDDDPDPAPVDASDPDPVDADPVADPDPAPIADDQSADPVADADPDPDPQASSADGTIATASSYGALVNLVAEAQTDEARAAAYDRLQALARQGVDVPTALDSPRVFMWLLATNAPVDTVKAAYAQLITSDGYKNLPRAQQAVTAKTYAAYIAA